ncbi:hypothetical protein [Muricauda brasiliensis]|uniref:hypothetical protein n=1 Tax=Muricauda brasiliensis TaxID=2162892 RepID=UPI000D377B0A|nr:hypothetical protein [Muricauda brasiliensis]
MNRKLLFLLFFGFIVSCTSKKKELQKDKPNNIFIDSTDFKFFQLEKFDIQEWYNGNLKLKPLTKDQAKKYYQYRLRNGEVDSNYYQFYSLQKNEDEIKIITILDGATGKFPNLRMLIYNSKDSLIGFHPVAGIGTNPDFNLKYKVTSERVNDTTYISTGIKEYVGEFDDGRVSRDSTITKFIIELGFMKEEKIVDRKEFKLK